jgi:NADH-quinone oxidoreductase subunit E
MSVSSSVSGDQPEHFEFTPEHAVRASAVIARYPEGRQASAVLPLLDMAQRQSGGWLPRAAMDYVASILGMAPVRVYEVASFYTMFHLRPVGRYLVQVCGTTPCWLRGADKLMQHCQKTLDIQPDGRSPDGRFSLIEVECLGACANAPMVQINDDYYEDLDVPALEALLESLRGDEKAGWVPPKPGSCLTKRASESPLVPVEERERWLAVAEASFAGVEIPSVAKKGSVAKTASTKKAPAIKAVAKEATTKTASTKATATKTVRKKKEGDA